MPTFNDTQAAHNKHKAIIKERQSQLKQQKDKYTKAAE